MKRSRSRSAHLNISREGGWFQKFARATSRFAGQPISFGLAIVVIVVWAITGPIFGFSDTWQLVINTGTTIVTFLMVFIIQNTQNRDSAAVQLKLDELLRSTKGSHNALLDIEELSQEELDKIKLCYEELAEKAIKDLRSGKSDIGTPEVKEHNGEAARKSGSREPKKERS